MSSLLVFEASAKHGSFTRAAAELSLSQSAVSRQVQALEEVLGITLFDRVGRHIELTEVGRMYFAAVSGGLTRIRDATVQAIAYRNGGGSLHLGVLPALGSKWLLPRLQGFYSRHPEILVHIHSRVGEINFEQAGLDAAICVGDGRWTGATSHRLFEEELVPVVGSSTPADRYASVADLQSAQLLQVAARPNLWREWFGKQGLSDRHLRLGPQFELTSHLLQAVSAGIGVGLVPRFLIRDELANGTLRIPFDVQPFVGAEYYLVIPAHKAAHKPVAAFREWLLGQL